MLLRSMLVVVSVLAFTIPASGQPTGAGPTPSRVTPTGAPPATAGPATPAPAAQSPRAVAPAPAAQKPADAPPPRRRGRDLNLQIELTITDQTGSAAGGKKVVSMLVADGTFGRIRTTQAGGSSPTINVDALPRILDGGGILTELTIEYRPPTRDDDKTVERPAVLNESLSVILQDGKPLMISQASDPANDRRMTIEVRASILK
jgi:hypothetical protein